MSEEKKLYVSQFGPSDDDSDSSSVYSGLEDEEMLDDSSDDESCPELVPVNGGDDNSLKNDDFEDENSLNDDDFEEDDDSSEDDFEDDESLNDDDFEEGKSSKDYEATKNDKSTGGEDKGGESINDSEAEDSNWINNEEDEGELSEDFFHKSEEEKEKEPTLDNEKNINEYEVDSSDEEDIRNTVGNIPISWYDEYDHIGYDVEGKKMMKPPPIGEIDDFLNKFDDPDYWRTAKNRMTGEMVKLTDEECEIIQNIQARRFPINAINQYEPFEDFFTFETMKHPVTNAPPHKRSFIPSKIEKKKVERMVHAIKMGWIKPRQAPKKKGPAFYAIWDGEKERRFKRRQYIPAPKRKLPGHEESYNPPPEYLFTEEEKQKWLSQEPYERKIDFIPQTFNCLRHVPSYSQFVNEAFERCLDLYLCPRKIRMRANVKDPNSLIPQLPKPKDLHPFPSVKALEYIGHDSIVRSITVEPQGQFLASGSDDHTVKVWEVLTGRCLRTFDVEGVVKCVAWCPNVSVCLLLIAVGRNILLINPKVGDKITISNTEALLESVPVDVENKAVKWLQPSDEKKLSGVRLTIEHSNEIKQIVWHARGDYFASFVPEVMAKGIVIHQLSRGQSQMPFQKIVGVIQNISFHPLRPYFYVATQKNIRIYNLLKEEQVKKLVSNCKWISSMAIHPGGDNIIVGSYDCRLCWFDIDLSSLPYRTLKHHKRAIRQVAFHKRYPLFASSSDDGSIIICHGMVYSDLLQNPLIVPVKVLRGHETVKDLNVLDCCFHPSRPWIFSSGADSKIILYT